MLLLCFLKECFLVQPEQMMILVVIDILRSIFFVWFCPSCSLVSSILSVFLILLILVMQIMQHWCLWCMTVSAPGNFESFRTGKPVAEHSVKNMHWSWKKGQLNAPRKIVILTLAILLIVNWFSLFSDVWIDFCQCFRQNVVPFQCYLVKALFLALTLSFPYVDNMIRYIYMHW